MRNGIEVQGYVNVIRQWARTVARSPFAKGAIVDACLWVERAGIPTGYRLPATAQEYAVCENSEQLVAIVAARVGNPRVSPMPPLWPLLSILLVGWLDSISAEHVMEQAAEFGVEDEAQRGLAMVAHLFPELQTWLATVPSRIPLWERTLAVPLAARKLVNVGEDGFVTEVRPIRWRVTGGSRRGARHVRSGLKNQDALEYSVSGDAAVVLAVADGHGSGLCCRSDTGSRLAVKTAAELLHRFSGTIRAGEPGPAIADRARAVLAGELTQSWRVAVQRHLEAKPFTPAEWASLAALQGWQGQQMVGRRPELAYGSTILGVLATETYVLCLQLGDGDILFVDSQGHTRRAVPKDNRLAAKPTASLSRRNAAAQVRVHVDASNDLPTLILAATDGYAKSYVSDHQFLKSGRDYLRIVRAEGFDSIEDRLTSLLDETSLEGSGDDITIGFLSRLDCQNVPDLSGVAAQSAPGWSK